MTFNQYFRKRYHPATLKLLTLPPAEVHSFVDTLSAEQREASSRDLESIAYFATAYAAYLDERYGYGAGDQGHETADKAALKAARKIWINVFGYNSHRSSSHFIPPKNKQ